MGINLIKQKAVKTCNKCGATKPLSEFYKSKFGHDKRLAKCKNCIRLESANYRSAHKEEISAKRTSYRLANLDKVRAIEAENYKKNIEREREKRRAYNASRKEKNKIQCAAYYAKNKEKALIKRAIYYDENKEKAKESCRAWRKANHEYVLSKNRNRRAREINATGKHTVDDIRRLLILQKGKCACCKQSIKAGYHVDHIIALANGGSNDPHNLQILCPTCNCKKHTKENIKFMQAQGFLL
jgi:5-methylcytosine-specific restriction endonuclease McrA